MAFLAVVVDVVAQCLDLFARELVVGDLGFLQTDHIRLMALDDCLELMRSGAQAIDIERNDFHARHPSKSLMLAHARLSWRPAGHVIHYASVGMMDDRLGRC
ncbi:hypothetical protein D3C81_840010 [compost metagenome]